MLAYAFQFLNEDGYANLTAQDFDYASDLLAAILAKGMSNQIRRGLGREYENKYEIFSSPTGKIDISGSIKKQTLLKKQLFCEVDEFTENTYINMVLKATIILLLRSSDVTINQKKLLKKIILHFSSVDNITPYQIEWAKIKYHRNNATYKMLINICYLVIEGLLITEETGEKKLSRYIDDQRMHSLYERFVLQYYRRHYEHFNVSSSQINWDVDDGIIDFLPVMKSDITIEYHDKTLIIDTKYYSKTMQFHDIYNSRTIHSNNLYQIFTYVKNKDITNSGNVSGVLLYAKTDEEITPNHNYLMNGNRISVKTLNLDDDFNKIELQLDDLLNSYFDDAKK
jgi:5-methylcytosine-specific restriction enzyme subunit McrC